MTKKSLEIKKFHRTPYTLGPHTTKKYEDACLSKVYLSPEILEKVQAWAKHCDNFLLFFGRAGCGKTYFCNALGKYILDCKAKKHETTVYKNEIIRHKWGGIKERIPTDEIVGTAIEIWHPEVLYLPVTIFYQNFRNIYNAKQSDNHLKRKLKEIDYLILDDIGATRNTDWQVEIFYEIIDSRYSNHKPTVITSNLTFEEIEGVFHQRVRSRLEATENFYFFDWETDLRLEGL